MLPRIVFHLVLIIGIFTTVQASGGNINLRGNVTCEGKAVPGAVVTLSGLDARDTTDANGDYAITKNNVAVLPSAAPQTEKITFRNGILQLCLPHSSMVKIAVFDVQGNLLKKELSSNTGTGFYRMNIAEVSRASKVLVIEASIGENSLTYRYIPLHNGRYALNRVSRKAASSGTHRLVKVAAAVDTLEVVKNGYATKIVAVESYDATVDISLARSDGTSGFVEDAGLGCEVGSPNGSNGGSSSVLPDPFTRWDGTQVRTMEDWRCRRRELVVEIGKRILGDKAPPPATIGGTVSGSISKSGYSVKVDNPKGSCSFSGTVSIPSGASTPCPAVIVVGGFNSLNSDVLSSEGVATISYDNNSIASEASGNFTTGKYYDANPDFKGNTSALVAWAWGVSRIIDMIEKNPGVIDPSKIAIHGCSRLGKAAFVIGAYDQRIALGLPLEPGTGGPAPLRALPVYGGQTLASANGEASWFGPMSKNYNANMAVDMNDVAAMYAPRGLLMMDNPHIDHLSYKANYLGCAAAMEVYKAMGKEDALWYLGNTGNGTHCSVRTEYGGPLRQMIRKFLKGDNTATTGGLDKHANHGNIDVASWTKTWKKGTFSK